jgi:hypothetical protein
VGSHAGRVRSCGPVQLYEISVLLTQPLLTLCSTRCGSCEARAVHVRQVHQQCEIMRDDTGFAAAPAGQAANNNNQSL